VQEQCIIEAPPSRYSPLSPATSTTPVLDTVTELKLPPPPGVCVPQFHAHAALHHSSGINVPARIRFMFCGKSNVRRSPERQSPPPPGPTNGVQLGRQHALVHHDANGTTVVTDPWGAKTT